MSTRDFPLLRELAPPAPVSLARPPRAVRATERFVLETVTDWQERPDLLHAWRALLAASAGPAQVYQTPAFFDHVAEMAGGRGSAYELLVARRRGDDAIVGIVPVHALRRDLDFRFGPVSLFKLRLRTCQVLGSIPLLDPAEPGLGEFVMRRLLARDACRAVYMHDVPAHLGASWDGMRDVSAYVLNGWRACHTQPLPDTVDAYLHKFGAKKRYNLARQVRLLEQEAGAVEVLRVERPDQVAGMLEACAAIEPAHVAEHATRRTELEGLARHGLLLCYVIRCGGTGVAVVHGVRSTATWHVHRMATGRAWRHLSVGTSAMHLALQDLLAHSPIRDVDFHYGSPKHKSRSIQVTKTRGHVLLYRSRSLAGMLLKAHALYDGWNERLIGRVKSILHKHA